MIKLIGVLIIVIGFALKLDTIAVVLIAGIATGLVGGLSFPEILSFAISKTTGKDTPFSLYQISFKKFPSI